MCIDSFALGIAIAADALGLAGGLGLDHRHLTVSAGAEAARRSPALHPDFRRLLLALGLHASIDCLHIGLWQIDALDTNVNNFDAERLSLLVDLAGDGAH